MGKIILTEDCNSYQHHKWTKDTWLQFNFIELFATEYQNLIFEKHQKIIS